MIKATQLLAILFVAFLINSVANAVNVQVSSVENMSERLVSVSGSYISTCNVDLKPEVSEVLPNIYRPVILIKLIPSEVSGICQQVEREFEYSLVVDLDKLAFDQVGEFDLAFAGADNSVGLLTVNMDKPHFQGQFEAASIEGQLNNDGGHYMVANADGVYKLAASNVEALEKYVGRKVIVSGYIFDDNANTVQDPLSSDHGQAHAPVVVIESIQSELSRPMTVLRQSLSIYNQM